jgi:hypothetical protein
MRDPAVEIFKIWPTFRDRHNYTRALSVEHLEQLEERFSASALPDDAKNEMFCDLISYLVRRAVCGLTPKNYNNVFLAILRQLHGDTLKPEVLRRVLSDLKGDASRWPVDAEFRIACLTGQLYDGRLDTAKIRSLLIELEARLRTTVRSEEPVAPSLSDLDVDHILPRSWFAHWPLPDGTSSTSEESSEVELLARIGETLSERQQSIANRQAAVSTLGNLTLLNLSVNREAQNYAFPDKRDLLIANTTLRLNVPLISRQSWDKKSIEKRGEDLAKAALEIWQGPRP